jgi:outer membrane lipoprotein-sorting protein
VPAQNLPFPAKVATRSELLDDLLKIGQSIDTLKATVTLEASGGALTTGVLTSYRETRGFLIVKRPSHIRLKGEAPLALATVFDMVSDGEIFKVSVPLQNTFIIGDTNTITEAENPVLNLRPQHVMNALFVDISRYMEDERVLAVMEEAVEGRKSFYVLMFVDNSQDVALLTEKLWIDRRDLTVVRKQMFGKDGVVETEVNYSQYETWDGINFPREVFIQRPVEDYSVKMEFMKTDLNTDLPGNVFFLPAPVGSELVRVGTESPR